MKERCYSSPNSPLLSFLLHQPGPREIREEFEKTAVKTTVSLTTVAKRLDMGDSAL